MPSSHLRAESALIRNCAARSGLKRKVHRSAKKIPRCPDYGRVRGCVRIPE